MKRLEMKRLEIKKREEDISPRQIFVRVMCITAVLVIFFYRVVRISINDDYTHTLLLVNPALMAFTWFMLGGKSFTKADVKNEVDRNRALKITILHSIFLVMSNISIALIARVLTEWNTVYRYQDDMILSLNVTVGHVINFFIGAAIVTMIISIWQYRNSAMEYYSVFCHGIGWLCMIVTYITRMSHLKQTGLENFCIIKYEWVYVESLLLTGIFLLYCSYERNHQLEKF